MPAQFIYECPVLLPSLARAEKIVPPEFIPCYEWFQRNTSKKIPKLPHNMNVRIGRVALSRLPGIHSPSSSDAVSYVNNRRYALSVHTSKEGKYKDLAPIPLADGTWILDYAAHSGSCNDQEYNEPLMNCPTDGVPVGVIDFNRTGSGYIVLGLAFVERFNTKTDMFTLHAPVLAKTEGDVAFIAPGFDQLPEDSQQVIAEYDGADERVFVTAQQVRRQQQSKFREVLIQAYGGTCAITATKVPGVLQAAHINPYRGKKSQVVTSGILLRADLHLLYDAHPITVDPDSRKIVMSNRLDNTPYLQYNRRTFRTPADSSLAPNPNLLAMHYEQFRQENKVLVA